MTAQNVAVLSEYDGAGFYTSEMKYDDRSALRTAIARMKEQHSHNGNHIVRTEPTL